LANNASDLAFENVAPALVNNLGGADPFTDIRNYEVIFIPATRRLSMLSEIEEVAKKKNDTDGTADDRGRLLQGLMARVRRLSDDGGYDYKDDGHCPEGLAIINFDVTISLADLNYDSAAQFKVDSHHCASALLLVLSGMFPCVFSFIWPSKCFK